MPPPPEPLFEALFFSSIGGGGDDGGGPGGELPSGPSKSSALGSMVDIMLSLHAIHLMKCGCS